MSPMANVRASRGISKDPWLFKIIENHCVMGIFYYIKKIMFNPSCVLSSYSHYHSCFHCYYKSCQRSTCTFSSLENIA